MTQPILQRSDEKWVLLATVLASSMAFIDTTALNVTLPRLQADLNVNGTELLWIVNAYALMLSALILVGGALGDRFGRKRVFMIGIGIFTAASIACGVATSGGFLVAARALQGIGGALMVPGSLALIAALFPDERRGIAIGTWSTFSTLTTIIGPVLGGFLADQGLWRFVFFINVPLAAIALFILVTRVPESTQTSTGARLDIVGAALATVGLAGLTYGFIQLGEAASENPVLAWIALAVGVVALVAFVLVELRVKHPMVPPRLFQSSTFSGANLLTLFLYAALGGWSFFLPLNLQQVQSYTASEAGLVFLPFALLLTVLSRQAGKYADRLGVRPFLIAGPIIAGLGFAWMATIGITSGIGDYFTSFFPGVVLMGIGMGITVAPLTTAVMNSAPREATGTASGVNNAVARTAGVLAVAIFGALALSLFSSTLNAQAVSLGLSPELQSAVSVEAAKLAGASVPAGVDAATGAALQIEIDWAFVQTFRVVCLLSAGLAWIAAGMAALMIKPKAS